MAKLSFGKALKKFQKIFLGGKLLDFKQFFLLEPQILQ